MRRLPLPLTVLAAIAAVVALGGLLLAFGPVREAMSLVLQGDLGGLRREIRDLGGTAAFVLLALAMIHVVVPFPSELPTAAAGFAFGFAAGFPLMLGAWTLSAVAAFVLADTAGRPLLERLIGASRLDTAERFADRAGTGGLLAIRLIPFIPFSGVCFACGVVGVPFRRYLWTTIVGTAPLTGLTVLLGSRLQTPSLGDPVLWAVLVALIAMVLSARPLGRRLRRHSDAEADREQATL